MSSVTPYDGTTGRADDGFSGTAANVNQYYQAGDIAWIMISSALVLLMIPGVGFFYSGLARRKSALSLIYLTMMSAAVISIQWFLWGYTLAFSKTGSSLLGDLTNFGLMKVQAAPSTGSSALPDVVFCLFQGMFAAITPALAIGAVVDRGRVLPALVFMFVWATVVYDPIAYWTWNPNGWLYRLGSLDFAGGGPVHISSGTAALAYSLMLGRRTGYHRVHGLPYRPHNVTHVILGTVFLWVGWFGFNGGSSLAADVRAAMACLVTSLAAAAGAVTWSVLDYRLERRWSAVGFCSGAIAGLVAITPASGYVSPWSGFVIGVIGAVACNFATKVKFLLRVDDALDIFAIHGIGGAVGNMLTGLFATVYVTRLSTTTPTADLGWLDGHFVQLGYQLAGTCSVFAWSFTFTSIICFLINLVPGLSLRAPAEEEDLGLDDGQLGEFAYDYVEVTRHVADGAGPRGSGGGGGGGFVALNEEKEARGVVA